MMRAARQPTEEELVELQRTLYTSRNPTRRWLHHRRRDWVLAAIRAVATECEPSASTALEVGPGSGIYLPALRDSFSEVVACDIEPGYLRAVPTRGAALSLIVDDITNSTLMSDSFDLVLCTEVVEHTMGSANALREMHRILRPGRALILTTPQRYSTLELACRIAFAPGMIGIARRVYREPVIATGHINAMTRRRVTEQLTQAGFRIEREEQCGLYLPGVAELLGTRAARISQSLERRWRGTRLSFLLWTQCYVARKAL